MKQLPDFSRCQLLVVGDVMLDRYWFGDVNRISPEAPVPVVHVKKREDRPGGAANVARNIAALGGQVTLLSVVGDDEPGRILEMKLEEEGVVSKFHRDPELETTVKLRVISRQQQLLRVDFEKPPSDEILESKWDDFKVHIENVDVVILSDYGKGGLAHVEKMIQLAKQHKKKVLIDPKGDDYSVYRGATMVTPNRNELMDLAKEGRRTSRDLEDVAKGLREAMEVDSLLVTRSEEGMSLFTAEGIWHEPTQAREVFDVSGAGDTVIAVLGLMMASGAELQDAMHIANRAAGVVVGKLGTATVSREELLNDLKARP